MIYTFTKSTCFSILHLNSIFFFCFFKRYNLSKTIRMQSFKLSPTVKFKELNNQKTKFSILKPFPFLILVSNYLYIFTHFFKFQLKKKLFILTIYLISIESSYNEKFH